MSLESTVVSLVPFDIREEKPGLFPPRFFIPESDMKIPSILHVSTCSHYVYLDESRGTLRVPDPSDQVARSICEDYIESQLGVDEHAKPALFWISDEVSAGDVLMKFKDLITDKLALQKQWFLNVAMLADKDWQNYHQHNVISSFQRKCARIIGWTKEGHEWMEPQTTMNSINCPYCGVAVDKSLPICSNGHVVNPKLHKEIEERQLAQVQS